MVRRFGGTPVWIGAASGWLILRPFAMVAVGASNATGGLLDALEPAMFPMDAVVEPELRKPRQGLGSRSGQGRTGASRPHAAGAQ